jgi:prophage regulatory protein
MTPERIIRIAELCRKVGLGRTTLWRMERDGEFPQRRQLGRGQVGWIESEVDAWIHSLPKADER